MAPKSDLSGVKFLIAAAAASGTVGGWIALAGDGAGAQSAVVQDPALLDLLNQPLPTLQQSSGSFFIGPVLDPSTAGVNQPAGQLTPLPTLRKVVAPSGGGGSGGAGAVTRSSRK
jgi:hypothetical protein